jgi:gliding motility-associated-like protein
MKMNFQGMTIFLRAFLPAAILLLVVNARPAMAQTCTSIGQNPETAFPVCGTGTFYQATVPLCGGRKVPGPCAPVVDDINPYWYKFTCFQGGTLAFEITPNQNSDDYDWQLFDVTSQNPQNVYTNAGLTISCNWSGSSGKTGMRPSATPDFVCYGVGKPLYSKSVLLTPGRNYLLLISHFTNSQSGYSLSFGGGTAVITDPAPPGLKKATATCDGQQVRLKLAKRMRCNTLAANGSDFVVTGSSPVTVTGAVSPQCQQGFDTDSVIINLSAPLPAGNYFIKVKNGTDGNSLLDFCDKPIPVTDSVPFNFTPATFTPMDSLAKVTCAPQQLKLVFRRAIQCSTIAADGSDFLVTGSYPVAVTSAAGVCDANGLSDVITVNLDKPLQTVGSFTIRLKPGSDGGTLTDECSQVTPPGASLSFSVKDTVNAGFDYNILYGCKTDTIELFHPGGNSVNRWQWFSDNAPVSTLQNPQLRYTVFGEKRIKLAVSNGFCSDTAQQVVNLDNTLLVNFEVPGFNCPNEPVAIQNTSSGKRLQYQWNLGDGFTSTDTNPQHIYPIRFNDTRYTITLRVTDSIGCTGQRSKTMMVVKTCVIYVPTAFTPNNDGLNDYFAPLYAVKAKEFEFYVYNRYGQIVFQSNNWLNTWDGRLRGQPAPPDTYVWMLRYVHRDTNKREMQKGTVVLMR